MSSNTRLKFRQWSDQIKKFHYWGPILRDGEYVGFKGPSSNDHFVQPHQSEQFTGLQDKNGKDIYEGDILREPEKQEWDKVNFIAYEVFYHDNDSADNHIGWQCNRAHFQGNLAGGTIWPKMLPKWTSKMVIIGNIHQNKDLLS